MEQGVQPGQGRTSQGRTVMFHLEERDLETVAGGEMGKVLWHQIALNPWIVSCYETMKIPNYVTYTNRVVLASPLRNLRISPELVQKIGDDNSDSGSFCHPCHDHKRLPQIHVLGRRKG